MWFKPIKEVDDSGESLDMDVEAAKTELQTIDYWVKQYTRGEDGYTVRPDRAKKEIDSTERIRQEQEAWQQTLEEGKHRYSEAQARYRLKQSRVLPYFGDLSPTERSILFAKSLLLPARNTMHNSKQVSDSMWSQNPYEDPRTGKTWRNRLQLEAANNPASKNFWKKNDADKELFKKTYTRQDTTSLVVLSYSRPELYRLSPLHREVFKQVLVTGDSDLLMKSTPLIDDKGEVIDDVSLAQIYNEIQIAFFLNELLYGYKHVLSIHFMVMVDWFQTSRAELGLFAGTTRTWRDEYQSQFTVSEYIEGSVLAFMRSHPTVAALKGLVFQVLHALETAWLTNEFVHYDLHTGNIMMKRTTGDQSPLAGRNLLYKRYGHSDWYQLGQSNLGDHIVKIIDFGFSRLCAPKAPAHKRYDLKKGVERHVHDRFIGLDWEVGEMNRQSGNMYTDVRLFLLDVLTLPVDIWQAMHTDERKTFYAMTADVLDFARINTLVDGVPVLNYERLTKAGGRLQPGNLVDCPQCMAYLMKFHGYARANSGEGMSAREVLDHPFFDSLRRPPLAHSELDRGKDDLVVSFFTTTGEEQMLKYLSSSSSSTATLYCEVCGSVAEHYNIEDDQVAVPLCSALCAEFKYLYNCKTVFR